MKPRHKLFGISVTIIGWIYFLGWFFTKYPVAHKWYDFGDGFVVAAVSVTLMALFFRCLDETF